MALRFYFVIVGITDWIASLPGGAGVDNLFNPPEFFLLIRGKL